MTEGMTPDDIRQLRNKLTREYDHNMLLIDNALERCIDYECKICERVVENHTGLPKGWNIITNEGKMYVLCDECNKRMEKRFS